MKVRRGPAAVSGDATNTLLVVCVFKKSAPQALHCLVGNTWVGRGRRAERLWHHQEPEDLLASMAYELMFLLTGLSTRAPRGLGICVKTLLRDCL